MCLQCEMDCLNNVIDITPVEFLQVDPLEYSAGLISVEEMGGGK